MKGYYINLECRRDRRRHIENNILTLDFFKDLERFDAIKKPYGIGCNESWLKVLEKCLSTDTEDRFLLIEDDIHIYDMEIFNNFIEDYKLMENNNWDVIHLTPRLYDKCRNQETLILESGDKYSRLHNCVTATGLIIKKEFIPILMKNLQYSTEKLKKTLNTPKYIIDISWLDLQEKYRIYGYNKSFCYQLECLSDINLFDEKYIGMYKTWGMEDENRLSKLLLRYIDNPRSDYNCFYLAREYEIEGQYALAKSYYLKCCDNTIYDEKNLGSSGNLSFVKYKIQIKDTIKNDFINFSNTVNNNNNNKSLSIEDIFKNDENINYEEITKRHGVIEFYNIKNFFEKN